MDKCPKPYTVRRSAATTSPTAVYEVWPRQNSAGVDRVKINKLTTYWTRSVTSLQHGSSLFTAKQ